MKHSIAFIILTWNSEKCILSCLSSVEESLIDGICGSVYVIDNGSTDKTVEHIEKWKQKHNIDVCLKRLSQNYGTTISRNIGIREVIHKVEYICILDSDTQMNAMALTEMIQVLGKDKKIGIIGPALKSLDGTLQKSGRAIPTVLTKLFKVMPIRFLKNKGERMESIDYQQPLVSVGYLMSACWIMRAETMKAVGLFDEKIFYAPEDVEYCMRAWAKGYKVIYSSNLYIVHEWQRLSRRKLFSRHNYEHIKGLIYIFLKYRFLFTTKKFDQLMK